MKKLLIIVLVLTSGRLWAQQRPVHSLYMFDPILVNPAYAGTQVQLSGTAIYRNQWVNLEGAPKTFTATVHSGFLKSKMGLGVIATNDKIGIHNDVGLYGVYSYKIKLTQLSSLSFGIQGGFNNLRSDYNLLNLKNQNDPNLAGVITKFNPNVGAGLFYRFKEVYLGFSVPQIIENKVFVNETLGPSLSKQVRYYYLFGGLNKKLSKDFRWIPSALVRLQGDAPMSFDINSTIVYKDAVGLGASYRLKEGFVGLFELQINENFHVGYAYDFTVTELSQFSSGSHEIMINYRIKIQGIHRGLPCPSYW
jgi:type IX secretion system PorP/SprF family membrane protein